jgi:hypothetical protein
MAIHPLDITPENEAAAESERAERRRANSMGCLLWFAVFVGCAGLIAAFVGACLLSRGPGPTEGVGMFLHQCGKLSLLASMCIALLHFSVKRQPSDQVIDAMFADEDNVQALIRSMGSPGTMPANMPAAAQWPGVAPATLPITRPAFSRESFQLAPPPIHPPPIQPPPNQPPPNQSSPNPLPPNRPSPNRILPGESQL